MFQGFVRCSPDKNATGRKLLSSAVWEAKKPQGGPSEGSPTTGCAMCKLLSEYLYVPNGSAKRSETMARDVVLYVEQPGSMDCTQT